MKRLFFAALLMLVISGLVVIPAFASDQCVEDPALHQATVASLSSHVGHAHEMGHIEDVLMPALTAPLKVAANESLPMAARVRALQAFVHLVNAQTGKGIDADCGPQLVTQAGQVIAALNG